MSSVILRRRKLGRTSCREICNRSLTGLTTVRNDKPVPEGVDLVFRWGTTSNVPCKDVVNTAAAIHEVNDKVGFRLKMDEAEVCPATFLSPADCELSDCDYPYVVRPKVHSRGRHLYVANTLGELMDAFNKAGDGAYASPLIKKVKEYRVFVVQGRVVCVAEKTPGNPDDVAWNVAKGGRFDNVRWDEWPLKAIRVSVEAFNLSSLDFGGVDVMVDAEGEAYVLEINSAPSLTSDYRQTCFAKAFDWIVNHGKKRIPLVEEKGGYLKFIHPAVCETAKLVGV